MPPEFRVPMSSPDIGAEEMDAVMSVLKSGWPTQGKVTEKFESMLSEYLSANVAVVNNGSSALLCSLAAHGLRPGDKVAVPSFTFIATSSAAKMLGARIVVVDSDPSTLNIDPGALEKSLRRHRDIKFVITVDVAGMPADVDAFVDLSRRYHFSLIEDAAEAFGARYKNRPLGSFEHTTIFSFQIAKQITTIEGGCISSLDRKILRAVQKIRDYGRTKERYVHDVIGANFRTTDLQSAIGIAQLKKVEEYVANRNKIAQEYMKRISIIGFQQVPKYVSRHSYMMFFGLAKDRRFRDRLVKHLVSRGIDARKSWTPIHLQPSNEELRRFRCPNAEDMFSRALTLPIYNTMTVDNARIVTDACNELE